MTDKKRICLGAFAGAHGVKGDFKIKTFTEEPKDVAKYGPLESEDGTRSFSIKVAKVLGPNIVLARAPEVKTREEATSLSSTRLYVERDRLPKAQEDEFYLEDLVGLEVIHADGTKTGVVVGVHNFGAGDILEIKNVPGRKGSVLIAFTMVNFPEIRLKAAQIIAADDALVEVSSPGDQERRG